MKITTRKQLVRLIAQRIYDDSCINDLEGYRSAECDWKQAEDVVRWFLDKEPDIPLWSKQRKSEDYDKFRHFIRNYEENSTDGERW